MYSNDEDPWFDDDDNQDLYGNTCGLEYPDKDEDFLTDYQLDLAKDNDEGDTEDVE